MVFCIAWLETAVNALITVLPSLQSDHESEEA